MQVFQAIATKVVSFGVVGIAPQNFFEKNQGALKIVPHQLLVAAQMEERLRVVRINGNRLVHLLLEEPKLIDVEIGQSNRFVQIRGVQAQSFRRTECLDRTHLVAGLPTRHTGQNSSRWRWLNPR